MSVRCERCFTENHAGATYCGRCSYALPLIDRSQRRWRIAFFILCGVVSVGLIWLAIKDIWPWDFDPRVYSVLKEVAASLLGLVLLTAVAALYFLPTIIAMRRRHHNAVAIMFVNLLFGLTFLGWCVALIWSVTAINDRLKKL